MTASADNASGHISFLDIVVLIAMAVTAFAFGAGLIINSGIDPMVGGIAAAALFLVMASSHFAITRATKPTSEAGRLEEIEEALILLDGDLQRIDRVEDDVARLDLLNDRVERLDKAVSGGAVVGANLAEDGEQFERLSSDLERLNLQLDVLRQELESEQRSHRDQIGAELRSLEGAIKDLSREVVASPAFAAAVAEAAPRVAETEIVMLEIGAGDDPGGSGTVLSFVDTEASTLELGEDEALELSSDESDEFVALLVEDTAVVVETEDEAEPTLDLAEVERMLSGGASSAVSSPSLSERLAQAFATNDDNSAKEAVEAGRIELHVAPIVSLPSRGLRYFDAMARLQDEAGRALPPDDALAAASRDRLSVKLDNVMLAKSVQLLRRLGIGAALGGVFCPLSGESLSDEDFFPELVEFLEENSTLGDSLIFSLDQKAVGQLGGDGLGGLKTIGRLGFRFALGGVTNLDADYAALRDHFFRFVKIDAGRLIRGGSGAPATPHHLVSYFDRFDLKLVATEVDGEGDLSRLMELGIELAEGELFAGPRPADAALFRELEEIGTSFA